MLTYAKAHVAALIALATTLVTTVQSFGTVTMANALPVVIALSGAVLTWAVPNLPAGPLHYLKLGVGLVTTGAQVVVPLMVDGRIGWGSWTVIALALFSAYKVWEIPNFPAHGVSVPVAPVSVTPVPVVVPPTAGSSVDALFTQAVTPVPAAAAPVVAEPPAVTP